MPIEIKELSFSYDSKPFIDNLDLKIDDGEMVGIIGNTGCGKSTFVRLIAGLIKSDSGKIIIDGDDITNKKFNKKILRRKLGIVFQFPEMQLFEQTIEKDIFFGLKQYKLTYDEKYKRAKEALELLGLDFERIKDKSPLALSGGEKRKIAVAGILVCKPKYLIFDEPIAGLDCNSRDNFMKLLLALKQNGTTIIIISHNTDYLAEYADRILALSEDAARAVSESIGDAGEIRLCLRSSAVLVSNVLKDFIHEQPHVSFSISSEPKGCDLLIDSVSSAYDIPDNAHLLMTEEICLAVSSSHPLAHTGHISVEQMMDEKFIDLADTPSYAGVFNSIFSKCKKTPQIAYSCNDYILQGKLISLGLGVSFVASVTWTSSSLPENISLLHIDDCPHFRSIYYQPLGSFCSENQRIFEHQLEEYFKKLNK